MRKRKTNGKFLFQVPSMTKQEPETPKRKRGRPSKQKQEPVIPVKPVEPLVKKRGRPKKEKVAVPVEPVVSQPVDNEWKDFNTTKPVTMQPVEFYVNMGKSKIDIFRGYIWQPGVTVTDEPYKLVVLRKKYGNLWYREIPGCVDTSNCPGGFPHCEKCKRRSK